MAIDPVTITLVVAGAAFVLFITDRIPPDITALSAAAALMLFGVLDPVQGLSGFSSEATVTVLCMFIVAAAVQRTGLVNLLAHKVIDMTANRPTRFTVLLVACGGVVSAFINNTPVVAILIPLVVTVAGRMGRSPSKFLIPLSFAAMLGGTMTVIGTSTNVLASSISDRIGYGSFSMFMFMKVGVWLFLIGGVYLVLIAPRLLPERHGAGDLTERFHLRDYVCELVVPDGSPLIDQQVHECDLKSRYDIDVIRIFRGDDAIDQPLVGVKLRPSDILLVRASRDELVQLRDWGGVAILPEVTHTLPGESGPSALVEAIIAPGAGIDGSTLRDAHFRHRYDAVVLAVKKRDRLFLRQFHTLPLEAGDTLLLSGQVQAIEALKSHQDFIIAEELENEKFRRNRAPHVLVILAAMISAVTFGIVPISVAALTSVILLVLTGSLRVHEMHESVRWDVVFLLAGVIPLGVALQTTGAADMIADWIGASAGGFPPMAVLAIIYATTVFLTQVMSNNASVALMIPVAVSVGASLGLNEFTFLLAVTFAASMGFMTPIAYQTNLMIYGPGEYKFSDFIRVGLPLTIILGVVSLWLLDLYWPLSG